MLGFGKTAAITAAIACQIPSAVAEPARPDPAFLARTDHARTPKALTRFRFAGANLSIVAIGRWAAADTRRRSDDLEEALAMAKVLPGYPQPAFVTFNLKLAF